MECYGPCFRNRGPYPRERSHAGCYASGKEHGILKAAWESRQTQTDHPGKLGLLSADPLGHDFLIQIGFCRMHADHSVFIFERGKSIIVIPVVGGILFQYLARPSGGDSDLRNQVSITKPPVYHSSHFYPPKEAPIPFGNIIIGFSSSLRF